MPYHYSDLTRESLDYALPDVETFYMSESEILDVLRVNGFVIDDDGDVCYADGSGVADEFPYSPGAAGFYYWFCTPGYLPEGDAIGPFATEQDAIDAMRDRCDYGDTSDNGELFAR